MPDSLCRVNACQPRHLTPIKSHVMPQIRRIAQCRAMQRLHLRSHGRARALLCARTAKAQAGTGVRQRLAFVVRPNGAALQMGRAMRHAVRQPPPRPFHRWLLARGARCEKEEVAKRPRPGEMNAEG